jgi:electron transport complex protein RnfG
MRDIPRFAATLTLIACIAAGSLAWINEITKPRIIREQERARNAGLQYVLSVTEKSVFDPIKIDGKIRYWEGYKDKSKDQFAGYAIQVPAKGYQSTIQTLVGLDSMGTILRIGIVFQQETPGLGTQCETIRSGETTPWWQDQFRDKNGASVQLGKEPRTIQSIAGATITSKAITDAIADSTKSFLSLIGKNGQK